MTEQNLDYLCAKYGQQIPSSKDDETLIQKALGVLQEDGLFAFSVFLESKDETILDRINKNSKELLDEVGLPKSDQFDSLREVALEITKTSDDTFLAKNLLERTLIYARYRAKALSD